jgi:hypothetical protein
MIWGSSHESFRRLRRSLLPPMSPMTRSIVKGLRTRRGFGIGMPGNLFRGRLLGPPYVNGSRHIPSGLLGVNSTSRTTALIDMCSQVEARRWRCIGRASLAIQER